MKRLAPLLTCVSIVALGCASSSDDATGNGGSAPTSSVTTTTTTTTTTTKVPSPLEDQTAPVSINGLVADGDTLWVASVAGDVVLQVDPATGAILQRVSTGGAGPDDVEIGPDSKVYFTGFGSGEVGAIVDGKVERVAQLEPGANPLGFTSDGTLYVGIAMMGDALYRVPLDGADPEVIATELGNMNAFVVTADDMILGPASDDTGGVVVKVDPSDGTWEVVASGLPAIFASAADSEGNYYVLASATGEVIQVDPDTGLNETVFKAEGAPFDNMAFDDDGNLYLSHFTTPQITEITRDGATRVIDVGTPG